MASQNLRTVWITLRATNYTSQVFNQVMRQCDDLDRREKKLISSSLRLGTAAMSAGMMFNTMGTQIGGAGGEILKQAGFMMNVIGVIGYLKAAYVALTAINWAHTTSVMGVSMAYWQLALAAGAAFASFLLVYNALMSLNSPAVSGIIAVILGIAAALWMLYVAESAASMGIGLAIGGAAAGAALAMGKQMNMFQTGTRMVGATGPAILHRGEVVYNPSSGRPTQIGNDLAGRTITRNTFTLDFSGSTIQTKADKEELMPWIKRALRDAIRSKE